MTLRIVLADDHPIVRSGVRLLVERSGKSEVVAEVDSAQALVASLEAAPCDLLITDFTMPGGSLPGGLNLLSLLRRRWPDLPVVVLTMVANVAVLRAILDSGVRGLVNKSDGLSEIPLAMNAVLHQRVYVSASLRSLMDSHPDGTALEIELPLSKREAEVMALFASGLSVSQIALRLNRSIKTISRQKMDAMQKLGLKSDLDIYAYARESGLIS